MQEVLALSRRKQQTELLPDVPFRAPGVEKLSDQATREMAGEVMNNLRNHILRVCVKCCSERARS
jgi:hypothetical protein